MSELNGDKARFQRLRKAGLQRRDRARAAYAVMKRQAAASHAAADSEQSGGVSRESSPGASPRLSPEILGSTRGAPGRAQRISS